MELSDKDCHLSSNSNFLYVTPDSTTEALPTADLADFIKLTLIESGSFSKVYKVQQKSTGRIFAMKAVRGLTGNREQAAAQLQSERLILSQLENPFLVKMHYSFRSGGKMYYVLEYIPGGELYKHARRVRRFALDQVRLYAAEIVLALEYLHARGIVYRDLKPENVLLTAAGHVKLTDFGLSKILLPDATLSAHTFCGTPAYMAPEIVRDAGHGFPVDWWSLGVLVYELLTGVPPFFSRFRQKVFRRILESEPRFPSDVGGAARDFVSQLLRKDPHTRLGGGRKGWRRVKAHEFFAGLDWDKVRRKKYRPTYVPEAQLLDVTLPWLTSSATHESAASAKASASMNDQPQSLHSRSTDAAADAAHPAPSGTPGTPRTPRTPIVPVPIAIPRDVSPACAVALLDGSETMTQTEPLSADDMSYSNDSELPLALPFRDAQRAAASDGNGTPSDLSSPLAGEIATLVQERRRHEATNEEFFASLTHPSEPRTLFADSYSANPELYEPRALGFHGDASSSPTPTSSAGLPPDSSSDFSENFNPFAADGFAASPTPTSDAPSSDISSYSHTSLSDL